MNGRIFFLMTLLVLAQTAYSQNKKQEQKAVRETIDQLFDAMRLGDSVKLKSVLHPSIRLMTVYRNKEGLAQMYEEPVQNFITAVGTPHEEVWDERISKVKISIDGDLAQAWMNYEFYLDDQFSHKGVNAFQFVRTSDGWMVIQITDTRRK